MTASRSSGRRLFIYLIVLALALAVLPLSRYYMARSTPPPPPTAETSTLLRYYRTRIKTDPSDVPSYLQLGRLEEHIDYYNSSLEHLQIARALGAPDSKTARLMGRCWLRLSRVEEGQSELEKAVRAQPDDVDAALEIAGYYFEAGRTSDALKILKFYLSHHPKLITDPSKNRREAVEKLMNAFVQVGDLKTGTDLAEKLIQLAPDEPNGYAVAGRCLLEEKRWSEAAERLAKSAALAPKMGSVHYYYGIALSHLPNQRRQALVEWEQAVASEDLAPAYIEIGREYARKKDWRRAAIAYLRAATIFKDDPDAYQLASILWQRAGRKELAHLCLARAALLSGDAQTALRESKSLVNSLDATWQQRGIDGCVEAYRLLPQKKAEHLQFLLNAKFLDQSDRAIRISDAYGELKNYDKRKEYLQRALRLNPLLAGHVHMELGKLAENAGHPDEAEIEYSQSIAADPQDPAVHRLLRNLYLNRRDMGDRLHRAIAEGEKVISLRPGEAADYHQLGVAYEAAGDYPHAVQALQHAIDLQPGYGPPYLALGQVSLHLGNRERGEELLRLYRKFQAFDLEKQTLTTQARVHRKNAAAQAALGSFYVRAQDFSRAATMFNLAARLAPNNREYSSRRDQIYSKLGRLDTPQQETQPDKALEGALQ